MEGPRCLPQPSCGYWPACVYGACILATVGIDALHILRCSWRRRLWCVPILRGTSPWMLWCILIIERQLSAEAAARSVAGELVLGCQRRRLDMLPVLLGRRHGESLCWHVIIQLFSIPTAVEAVWIQSLTIIVISTKVSTWPVPLRCRPSYAELAFMVISATSSGTHLCRSSRRESALRPHRAAPASGCF